MREHPFAFKAKPATWPVHLPWYAVTVLPRLLLGVNERFYFSTNGASLTQPNILAVLLL